MRDNVKITINHLRKIIKEEILKINKKSLMSEAHVRITPEEIMAWKNGDWGYSSLNESEELSPQYKMTREDLLTWFSDLSQEKTGVSSTAIDPNATLVDLEQEINDLIKMPPNNY